LVIGVKVMAAIEARELEERLSQPELNLLVAAHILFD
jgi:hypothetical protein